VENPNNKMDKHVYNVEVDTFSTYLISPMKLHEINLRYEKVVNQKYPIIIEEDEKEENST
jgi:hypothetical protein